MKPALKEKYATRSVDYLVRGRFITVHGIDVYESAEGGGGEDHSYHCLGGLLRLLQENPECLEVEFNSPNRHWVISKEKP